MMRWAIPAVLLTALLVSPLAATPAAAADVNVTLVAFNVVWHLTSQTGTASPTITVNPGDVLRLRIENHDAMGHTFTFPHFAVNTALPAGGTTNPTVIFVNITTSSSDNGKWQFYCAIAGHASGADESRTGMVGWVQVGSTAPPRTPGVEVVLVVGAIGIVAVAMRVAHRKT